MKKQSQEGELPPIDPPSELLPFPIMHTNGTNKHLKEEVLYYGTSMF